MSKKKKQLDFSNMTWFCEICHRERIDSKISVHKVETKTPRGVEITRNIKYCNDSLLCEGGAKSRGRTWLMEVENDEPSPAT